MGALTHRIQVPDIGGIASPTLPTVMVVGTSCHDVLTVGLVCFSCLTRLHAGACRSDKRTQLEGFGFKESSELLFG